VCQCRRALKVEHRTDSHVAQNTCRVGELSTSEIMQLLVRVRLRWYRHVINISSSSSSSLWVEDAPRLRWICELLIGGTDDDVTRSTSNPVSARASSSSSPLTAFYNRYDPDRPFSDEPVSSFTSQNTKSQCRLFTLQWQTLQN